MNRRYWFARHFAPKVYWSPDAGGTSASSGEAGGTSATAAAASAAASAAEAAVSQAANPQAPAGAQTFTLEEVTKLIQSEADKRVTQALKKQQAEFERRAQLSGLNDSERALAEKEDEIEKLNAQLRDLNGYKAKAAVLAALSEAHLPATFADVITIDPDPEAAQVNAARVKALSDAFARAVEASVTQRPLYTDDKF